MNGFVDIKSREQIFAKFAEFKRLKRGIFLIFGKSGSGKSFLLERLCKEHNLSLNLAIFNDKNEFENLLKNDLILLDESANLSNELLELIRINSDKIGFVLSSHKFLSVFKKEHFDSRVFAKFELKRLDLVELDFYIFTKFKLKFSKKELNFINKIYKSNLRLLDKLLQNYLDFKGFYKDSKRPLYILKLSALECNLLG